MKQVTGNVRILVVNPKDEEEKRNGPKAEVVKADKGLAAPKVNSGAPKTPAKAPAVADAKKSPAKDPKAKKDDNTIELKKDAKGLGLSIVGGSDTPLVNN